MAVIEQAPAPSFLPGGAVEAARRDAADSRCLLSDKVKGSSCLLRCAQVLSAQAGQLHGQP